MPWQEADDEGRGLDSAIVEVTRQQKIADEVLGDRADGDKYQALLSDARIQTNIADNAFIMKSTANIAHDEVGIRGAQTSTVRGYMELATWQETQAAAKSNLAQLSAKRTKTGRKEEYLRLDEGFKLQRSNISRQLAWLQIAEHCRVGSELNFDERLSQYKRLFEANVVPLVQRARLIEKGLRDVYGITLPLGLLETGTILDRIGVWLVTASDAISKWKRTQRLSVLQFVSSEIPELDLKRGMFSTQFSVTSGDLPQTASLLRGLNFEFVGNSQIPIALDVSPPSRCGAWGERQAAKVRPRMRNRARLGFTTATFGYDLERLSDGRMER